MRSHPIAARRGARFAAAAGLLIASTGVAVLTTAPTASAADNVIVCHATSSDANPYRVIEVDEASTQLEAHLAHQESPTKIWKTAGTFNGVPHSAGDPKPDMVGVASASDCSDSGVGEQETTADVVFVDPTCENNTASYTTTVGPYSWSETAPAAPGAEITVTATVDDGYAFPGDEQTYSETHVFGPALDPEAPPCVDRTVLPAEPTFADPTCDNANVASVQLPTTEGVEYAVEGEAAPGASVTVTATAVDPLVLEDGATAEWNHTFTAAESPCSAVIPPVEPIVDPPRQPIVSPPAQGTPPSTVVPSVVKAGFGGSAETSGPGTSLDAGYALVAFGGGLLLMGAAGMGFTRRRDERA